MEININTLINEVEKRPAIWDMSNHDYSNRTMKGRVGAYFLWHRGFEREEKKFRFLINLYFIILMLY